MILTYFQITKSIFKTAGFAIMKRLTFYLICVVVLLTLVLDYEQAIAGYALDYDLDQRDLVQIPETESLDITGQAITIEMWINTPTPNAASMTLLNKESSYEIQVNQGNFQFAIMTNGRWAWEGSGRVNANEWTHLACTYDGQNVRNYINGENTSTVRRNGNIEASDEDLYLATRPLNNFILNYNGMMDEVRLWNVVRTEDEIHDNMSFMLSGEEEGLVGYWRLDEGEGQIVRDLTANENHGHLGFDPDEEEQIDPEWVESDAPIFGGEAQLSRESIAFMPIPRGQERVGTILLSNISEEGDENLFFDFAFQFQNGNQPAWLTVNPLEGRLEAGEEQEITFTVNAENINVGDYAHTVTFLTNSVNLSSIDIPVTATVVNGSGQLSGRVSDAETGDPVEGAVVKIVADYELQAITDQEGNYEFQDIPAYTYHLQVSAETYLIANAAEVIVENNRRTSLDFELLYSRFVSNPAQVDIAVSMDDTLDYLLLIDNEGNGPLTWEVEPSFPGGEVEPWDLVDNLDVGEFIDDRRLMGVEFINGQYYITGGAFDEDNANRVYVVSREGELVRSFPQPSVSRLGMRDIAWDGQLIWGGDADTVYGFTTDGELISQFTSPIDPSRCIAWDRDHQLLWISDRTTDIVGMTREGEVVREVERPPVSSNYGLGWFPEDPDGFNLYVLSSTVANPLEFYKINIETNEYQLVANLSDIDGASEGGMTITTEFDLFNWTVINFVDDIESVTTWQLKNRSEWLTLSSNAGVSAAGEESDLMLRFATAGFPDETELEAELRFTHDGRGETIVPIHIAVSLEGGLAQRSIYLRLGWNLISSNIQPEQENLADVLGSLVENNQLMIAKNGNGNFYVPGEFDNIGAWDNLDGYWLKLRRDGVLRINGEALGVDTPIDLENGWNTISYLPRRAMDAPVALAGLGESILVAKDGRGKFYIPLYRFSNMIMQEGLGYQVKVEGDQQLVYDNGNRVMSTTRYYSPADLAWMNEFEPSELSFSLLLLTDDLVSGTRLEACTSSGKIVGRGVVMDGKCGLTIWGTDPISEEIIVSENKRPLKLTWIDGDNETWGVARPENNVSLPVEFGLQATYPNPFNNQLHIQFGIGITEDVKLTVFDLSGREMETLVYERLSAGVHNVNWNAAGLPSGLYILRLTSATQSSTVKAILMK